MIPNPVNPVHPVHNNGLSDYDALGHRVRKIDAVAGTTTLYYIDPEWRVLAEYAPTNNQQLRKYVYGNYIDEMLVLIDTYDSDNSPVGTYCFLHDHLYSPAVLIGYDDENEIWIPVERYEYDAYGTTRIMDPGFGSRTATQYGVTTLFTGRTLDTLDSGALEIMYYRHRYTDPFTGRFLQQDPMGYKDGLNLYEYVKSNPQNAFDPNGRDIFVLQGGDSGNSYDKLHQKICVDRWETRVIDGTEVLQRTGELACFSFAVRPGKKVGFPLFKKTWLGWNSIVVAGCLRGEIYQDSYTEGLVIRQKYTTSFQDTLWLNYMWKRKGEVDVYSVARHNCRMYSNMEFDDAPGTEYRIPNN